MKTHQIIGAEGLKLRVWETGNSRGKSILFIHGLLQSHLAWRKQIYSTLARDFRLVAMDIRGHGLSEKPTEAYEGSKLWAEDVHALIHRLELKQPLLVGWSYGGAIMSDYVSRYGESDIAGTSWVSAISRVGMPLREKDFLGAAFLSVVPGLLSQDRDDNLRSRRTFLRLCGYKKITPAEFFSICRHSLKVPQYVLLGMLSRSLNNDEVIGRMRKRMLLTYGDCDAVVSLSMGQHLARLAPHAKLSVYRGVGHAPFWEAPRRFNLELRQFRESV